MATERWLADDGAELDDHVKEDEDLPGDHVRLPVAQIARAPQRAPGTPLAWSRRLHDHRTYLPFGRTERRLLNGGSAHAERAEDGPADCAIRAKANRHCGGRRCARQPKGQVAAVTSRRLPRRASRGRVAMPSASSDAFRVAQPVVGAQAVPQRGAIGRLIAVDDGGSGEVDAQAELLRGAEQHHVLAAEDAELRVEPNVGVTAEPVARHHRVVRRHNRHARPVGRVHQALVQERLIGRPRRLPSGIVSSHGPVSARRQ